MGEERAQNSDRRYRTSLIGDQSIDAATPNRRRACPAPVDGGVRAAAQGDRAPPSGIAAMTKRVVHVVDDTEEVRTSLVFLLRGEGYACRAFDNGSAFLTELLTLDPGCVLLDFQMPGLTGLEVLSEFQRMEVGWPVVMMTGQGNFNLAMQAMRDGAFDFLKKPFDVETLMQILDRAFSSGKIGAQTAAAGGWSRASDVEKPAAFRREA
jgi:CheY-like chemotaxis protein